MRGLISKDTSTMAKPPVGIIGGMGPRASLRLCSLLTDLSNARTDQENIPFILDSNCLIPDRTQAIYYGGEDCLPPLIESARRLQSAGSGFLLLACVTAHYYLNQVRSAVHIPVMNMIEETAETIYAEWGSKVKVGLLATSGTVRSSIFDVALAQKGIHVVYPSHHAQEKLVMEAIYGPRGIKASYKEEPLELLKKAIDELMRKDVDHIILGCTDISEAFHARLDFFSFIDPMEILARRAIETWKEAGRLIPNS